MSGYAERGYNKFIAGQIDLFYSIIKEEILPTLPAKYSFDMVYNFLTQYYPLEIRAFQFELDGYTHQDKTLLKIKHHKRYFVKPIKDYFGCSKIANLLDENYISKRAESITEKECLNNKEILIKKRESIIKNKLEKIKKAQMNAQELEPVFIDKMLGLYDRHSFTAEHQKNRVYILHELYKYDCPKITNFLHKQLNHEQNFQLREMMFKHLQDYGYLPKLKKKKAIPFNTKNKNKKKCIREYRNFYFAIEGIPTELSYLINNSQSQRIKTYDFFISHSHIDHADVQKIIIGLNKERKNVYCDWISDQDYLKRSLLCDATIKVINKRIEQSNCILLVDTPNSRSSIWVAYELKYAKNIGKPIYSVSIDMPLTLSGIKELKDEWYKQINTDNLIY